MKLTLTLISTALTLIVHAQTNNFPLYSSGDYSGGTGDLTNITNPQLKLAAPVGYPRAVFISNSSYVGAVFNFQTGKNAYWGEPTDAGNYFFRGRDLVVEQGKLDVAGKGKFSNNVKIFSSPESWAEGLTIIKSSGWSGVRLTRNDPATNNYEGNWALGYAGTNNDFSVSTNYNGTQYDGLFHISNTTRNVGIGTSTPAERLEVNGNITVGTSGSTAETGPGAKLNFLGASENSDVLWLSRYNNGFNNAELRVNIGDDNGGDDSFTVGNIFYGDSQWKTFFKVLNNGKVGIGTGAGNVTSDAALTVALENTNGWSGNLKALKLISPDNGYSLAINTYVVAGGNVGYQFSPNGNTGMVITTPGNVGIGTTSPDAKLSVKGQLHAQEVKVDLNGAVAPDYVFAKNYKLPSLEELQSYIEANQHLPEVPSAKEMEERGINVGEMNLLLLKKVEELTLHLIAESAARKKLESEVAQLKNQK